MLISQMSFEKTFGLSSVFIESTLMENGGVPESANSPTLIKEAIHVISCGYEEKTEWGKEVRLELLLLLLLYASFKVSRAYKDRKSISKLAFFSYFLGGFFYNITSAEFQSNEYKYSDFNGAFGRLAGYTDQSLRIS